MAGEQNRYLLGNYNFSRRVVDHRYPFDFFYKINQNTWSPEWFLAARNWVIGGLVQRLALVACCVPPIILIAINEIEAHNRPDTSEISQHPFVRPRYPPSLNYIQNFNNSLANKGKWNHNFSCWQNDPLCGRDF